MKNALATAVAIDPAVSSGFTDAVTLIGLLAAATVGVVLAGIGVRVGIKWLRGAFNKA